MLRKPLIAALLLCLVAPVAPAAALPAAPLATATPAVVPDGRDDVAPASFWAQPYPYGYRWRKRPCRSDVCAGAPMRVPTCPTPRRAAVCR
ncbi:hypothetical protein PQJ75_29700 [Rhodoplanes sp. TEM]|uniref:Secreted protein n=1 Tax=Rhodoplanes tepidamans TaxID=200616 RepID=A0ABT5JIH8_RHOTP|nr:MULTISPECIES: hypothetical protein [Rhodoplanes]MDC7789519.1 hypothetical protein [Rhodoplanes tepidamans]MDC7987929.1 hypothetical protein [Rhodoplanes sp. TEM]MDQ0359104.1 hypothetical protein [Rhodoplanes tepidamans]